MSWIWALAAAAAMFGQDLLATWLVQAESQYRGHRAGLLDAACWPMGMAVTVTTVQAFAGHDLALKAAVVAGVSAANYAGTRTAIALARRRREVPVAPGA